MSPALRTAFVLIEWMRRQMPRHRLLRRRPDTDRSGGAEDRCPEVGSATSLSFKAEALRTNSLPEWILSTATSESTSFSAAAVYRSATKADTNPTNQRPQTETRAAYGTTSGSARLAGENRFAMAPISALRKSGLPVQSHRPTSPTWMRFAVPGPMHLSVPAQQHPCNSGRAATAAVAHADLHQSPGPLGVNNVPIRLGTTVPGNEQKRKAIPSVLIYRKS